MPKQKKTNHRCLSVCVNRISSLCCCVLSYTYSTHQYRTVILCYFIIVIHKLYFVSKFSVSIHWLSWIELKLCVFFHAARTHTSHQFVSTFAALLSIYFSLYFHFIFRVIHNKFKSIKMPRSLRSGSRRKKLQVQQIQQVNKKLRVSINNCIESNIADFNQIEFLSLFGLTQIVQSNSQKSKCNGCITRSPPNHTTDENIGKDSLEGTFSMNNVSHTGSSAIDYNDAFKIRYALGKCHTIFSICAYRCMPYLPWYFWRKCAAILWV